MNPASVVIAAKHLLAARPQHLAFRALAPRFARVFNQLVSAIQIRSVGGGIHVSTDTKSIYGRILLHQPLEHVFIDAAAGKDGRILQPAAIEDAPHLERMIGQIPAVETHSFNFDPFFHQLGRETNDFFGSGFRVVGIDEQNYVLRQRTREVLKRGGLIVVRLHKRMGHRAVNRDAEERRRHDGSAPRKPAEVTRPRG